MPALTGTIRFIRGTIIGVLILSPTAIYAIQTFKHAIFAGGCFWCLEHDFDKVKGVKQTISGYIGGTTPNPTYQLVSSGKTNYTESVKVIYDPKEVSYKALLRVFWYNVDPTRNNGQFCDRGRQYRPGIFYNTPQEKKLAEQSLKVVKNLLKLPIRVEITQATHFYPAEEYHQNYANKNPLRYKFYRFNCGRDRRLKQIWHGKKLDL